MEQSNHHQQRWLVLQQADQRRLPLLPLVKSKPDGRHDGNQKKKRKQSALRKQTKCSWRGLSERDSSSLRPICQTSTARQSVRVFEARQTDRPTKKLRQHSFPEIIKSSITEPKERSALRFIISSRQPRLDLRQRWNSIPARFALRHGRERFSRAMLRHDARSRACCPHKHERPHRQRRRTIDTSRFWLLF